MKTTIAIFGLCLAGLFACREESGNFKSLSADEFATLIADPAVQLLDVRTVAEYSEGHIPGSININVLNEKDFSDVADSLLQKERPVALYCRSGKRSKRAATILSKKGYKVFELSTGFQGWQEGGRETEQ